MKPLQQVEYDYQTACLKQQLQDAEYERNKGILDHSGYMKRIVQIQGDYVKIVADILRNH